MSDDVRTVSFPDGWGSGVPLETLGGEIGPGVHVAAVLLDDGSNLFALIYPGGARFARTADAIDWGIEERYDGLPPKDGEKALVNTYWRGVLDQIEKAGRMVDDAYEAEGLPPYRKRQPR